MTADQQKVERRGSSMSTKKVELESMSLDGLWSLHEQISAILSARIKSEKHELEKRLAVLNRGNDIISQSGAPGSLGTTRLRGGSEGVVSRGPASELLRC